MECGGLPPFSQHVRVGAVALGEACLARAPLRIQFAITRPATVRRNRQLNVIPNGVLRFFFPVPQLRDGRGTQRGICLLREMAGKSLLVVTSATA
jgi:hypothetical protein